MPWDEQSELTYTDWGGKRFAALAAVLAIWMVVTPICVVDMAKPKYRGDLTIAQFAENYNFYYSTYDENVTRTERLQPDGKWYPESDQYVTVYIDGQPEVPEQTFFYETGNGYLTSIRYENSWTEIFFLNPVPNQCKIAAITVLMSQNGNGLKELYDFGERLDAVDFTKDGTFAYEGIEMRWNIETENCVSLDGQRLTFEDESLPSSVSTVFEIRIKS